MVNFKKLSGQKSYTFSQCNLNHSDANHIFRGICENFVVFGQSPEITQPGKSSFNNPTNWQNGKRIFYFFGDMQFQL